MLSREAIDAVACLYAHHAGKELVDEAIPSCNRLLANIDGVSGHEKKAVVGEVDDVLPAQAIDFWAGKAPADDLDVSSISGEGDAMCSDKSLTKRHEAVVEVDRLWQSHLAHDHDFGI